MIMGILDAMFRNKIGAPSKKELFDNRVSIYGKIVEIKNDMEDHALKDFQDMNISDWLILQAKEKQINNRFINGDISEDDYLNLINACREAMKDAIVNYIDGQDEETVYGILKNSLKRIKKENIHLQNIDKMEFDWWRQIEASAELAQLTITQIVNSGEYSQSIRDNKQIAYYQVRKHFKK